MNMTNIYREVSIFWFFIFLFGLSIFLFSFPSENKKYSTNEYFRLGIHVIGRLLISIPLLLEGPFISGILAMLSALIFKNLYMLPVFSAVAWSVWPLMYRVGIEFKRGSA
jgi:hypothetical protein